MNEENPTPARADRESDSSPRILIGGISFSLLDDIGLLRLIERCIAVRHPITVAHPNVHHLNVARTDAALREALARFDLLIPDGIGVYIAAKFLYGLKAGFPRRQTGTDFYFKLLNRSNELHWRVYFLGDKPEVLNELRETIRRDYGGIVVAGVHDGFFPMDDDSIAEQIRASKADILMVGMGVPRQELWLQRYKGRVEVPVCLVVGGGISFIAGMKKRAPQWMQTLGFEWAHRMALEPNRLWSRYVLGIPSFFIYLLKLKLGGE